MKYYFFCSDQRKQKLSPVYKHLNVPTITDENMLLIIVLVNKFEREHSEQKKKQETLICKCVFSGEKNKSVSAVDRVMGRRAPILFALQIKEKICIPSTSDQHFYKFSIQESNRLKINGMCGQT